MVHVLTCGLDCRRNCRRHGYRYWSKVGRNAGFRNLQRRDGLRRCFSWIGGLHAGDRVARAFSPAINLTADGQRQLSGGPRHLERPGERTLSRALMGDWDRIGVPSRGDEGLGRPGTVEPRGRSGGKEPALQRNCALSGFRFRPQDVFWQGAGEPALPESRSGRAPGGSIRKVGNGKEFPD